MKAKFLGAPLVAVAVLLASASAKDALSDQRARSGFTVPRSWTRAGVVLERQKDAKGTSVSGDPCIVWDEAIKGWRMVLFHSPPGHAQAVCLNRDDIGPGQWKLEGPLPVTNPDAVGGFHKPFIVMDPDRPNRAA